MVLAQGPGDGAAGAIAGKGVGGPEPLPPSMSYYEHIPTLGRQPKAASHCYYPYLALAPRVL